MAIRASALLTILALILPGCGLRRFPWPLERDVSTLLTHAEVRTLSHGYDRTRSRVLVRRVDRPTRANLDWAAYHANVLTWDPKEPIPEGARDWGPSDFFGGVLATDSIVPSIEQTDLTAAERRRPLAFSPMVDHLSRWNYEQSSGLEDARAAVRTFSWGLGRNVQLTYQEISAAWLHRPAASGEVEMWVQIEFQPWARLFADIPDEDGDGFPQVYARLKTGLLTGPAAAHLERVYAGEVLGAKEVRAWANELASYWYPSYNTDVVDLGANSTWPLPDTEPAIVAGFKGEPLDSPAVVIRAKPHGEAIYLVLMIPGVGPAAPSSTRDPKPSGAKASGEPSPDPSPAIACIQEELARHGQGSWDKWAASTRPWQDAIRKQLKGRPEDIKALIGRDGFLFFRNSLAYTTGGDLQEQAAGKNPFRTIVDFKDYLASKQVDFLLVPIPPKGEVFPDKVLDLGGSRRELPVLNPYGRKLLLELAQAGVEVVDLLPAYLEARRQTTPDQELLYQPQDTHWTDRGLRLAAALLAKRIKRYPWFTDALGDAVVYSIEQVVIKRQGDLVSRLTDAEQLRFKPATLRGQKVIGPDGKPYDDDPASPIVILGDSFTGVYQRTDCRSAGVSAHLARELGHPVDLVMSYGGGPNVRRKLMRRGEEGLAHKRLVIWMFAARDLYDYWEDWEPLERSE